MHNIDLWLQDIIEDILIAKMYKILKEDNTISSTDRIKSAKILETIDKKYQISIEIDYSYLRSSIYYYEQTFTKQEIVLFLLEE